MAKGSRIKGITIEIGGDTTPLQKALKDVDKSLKTTTDNLKDVNKLLKLDPNNIGLLTQKQDLLNKAVKDTKERLKTLKDAYKELKNADQTDQSAQDMAALEREIADTEQKLKSLKDEAKEFGNVAGTVFQNVGEKVTEVGDKVIGVGKNLTTKVTLPLAAGFGVAVSKASDYTENINKMQVAFGDFSDEVQAFTDNAYLEYGLSKVNASDIASGFGALAKGIGLSDQEAASMSVTLTGLSSDLASYFNTDVTSAGTALEAIFTGNAQALKQYGVVMTDVNLKEFAESIGMTAKEYANLGAEEKTMLRFNYVMSQTADAQGDFSRTNGDFANSSRTLQASLDDLATVLGEQLLPLITPLITQLTEIITKISSLDPAIWDTITKILLGVAAIGPVITAIGTVIKVVGTVIAVLGTVVKVIGAIIGGIGTVVSTIGAVPAIIIAALAALVAWIVTHWEETKNFFINLWTTVKDFVVNTWNTIRDAFINKGIEIVTWVQDKFTAIKDTIKNTMDKARDAVKSAIDKIKSFFNFKWELPKLKMPHFKKVGETFLGLPKIEVEWYAKAMKNGMILDSATIFGAANGRLLGAGEAGSETIVGTNSLMNMIQQAVGTNGMTVNMTVNGGNVSANELASIVIDKLTTQIQRNNNRW